MDTAQASDHLQLPAAMPRLLQNMLEAGRLWCQAVALIQEQAAESGSPEGGAAPKMLESLATATQDVWAAIWSDPALMARIQQGWWMDYMALCQSTGQRMLGEAARPVIAPDAKDRRFRAEAWNDHPWFDYIKQAYLLAVRWSLEAVQQAEDVPPHQRHVAEFYTRQLLDALSPSNSALLNPEVMQQTLDSEGENLVQGMQLMLEDVKKGGGRLSIRMTDENAFRLGENIAATPGKVVFQNDLMQLIQYAPQTEQVHEVPLLLVPAWINKFYVFDLQPETSLIRWLVSQGYTVFTVSWINPDSALAGKRFDDYLLEGPLKALDIMRDITGSEKASIVGYCLGGTLTATLLAWLARRGEQDRIASVTYLTTLVDFSHDVGDLGVFIDEGQLEALESRMQEKGYLEGSDMALTFNLLRSNDLIWSFFVNNYLLGRAPMPFDLLYWNNDATRMPAAMHMFYLRRMYMDNALVQPDALEIAGEKIDLGLIEVPSFLLSTREDHIAPWRATYEATKIYGGEVEFVLADSGHIAGVINPPGRKKYGYRHVKGKPPADPDAFLEASSHEMESWWLHWDAWQRRFAGKTVPARQPGSKDYPPIENAPGSYVRMRSGQAVAESPPAAKKRRSRKKR